MTVILYPLDTFYYKKELIIHLKLFYFMSTIDAQVKYPRCCNIEPEYLITYDCGPDPQQTMLVCKNHFKDEPFQRFAIKIEKLRE